ncbi:hypothetical protein EAO68_15245 [Streptomyces sp. wa22]|nr:hypothetical protein EAO68_15245 [Streptomyces sp. wa22]
MDLRYTDAVPTDAEREAVDALLGPPPSGWEGAAERTDKDLRWARGGAAAAKDRRDQLLPALHAVNDRVGWISEGALNHICRRLTVAPAEAYGVATFYSLLSVRPRPAKVLHVCTDLACAARGSGAVCADRGDQPRCGGGGDHGGAADRACGGRWRGQRGCIRRIRPRLEQQCRRGPLAQAQTGALLPDRALGRGTRRPQSLGEVRAHGTRAPGRRCRPPGRRSLARAPQADRHGGPRLAGRLPLDRRLHRAAPRVQARPRRGDPRGAGRRARRPRRRGLPDRAQVAGHRAAGRRPALPGVQRGRERARHLQGPGADGG